METNQSLSIPDNSMLLFEEIGVTGDVIEYCKKSILNQCSSKFHSEIVERKILSSSSGYEQWFGDGFPAQVIVSGEKWQKGKVRLRIVTEFIPDDDESENLPEQPIEPSFDEFRE